MAKIIIRDVVTREELGTLTAAGETVTASDEFAESFIATRAAGGDDDGPWTRRQAFDYYARGWSNGYVSIGP